MMRRTLLSAAVALLGLVGNIQAQTCSDCGPRTTGRWVLLVSQQKVGYGVQRADGLWVVDPATKRPATVADYAAVGRPAPPSAPVVAYAAVPGVGTGLLAYDAVAAEINAVRARHGLA